MRIALCAVGKIRDRHLRAVLDDYLGRIRRYTKLDEIELKDASPEQVAERFAKVIDPRGRTVALEVDGRAWSSVRLARYLGECELASVPSLTFLIGGAYGLPREVSDAADLKLSLSAMTLPHRLARVLLAEQIYRAYSIQRGEPYAHE